MKFALHRFWSKFPLAILLSLFAVASLKAYVTTQTTLIGYRIGQKKQIEADLLEKQSYLKMELAKISTRQNLLEMAARNETAAEAWASH